MGGMCGLRSLPILRKGLSMEEAGMGGGGTIGRGATGEAMGGMTGV